MIENIVGQLAEVSGEAKPKNGTVKLQEANVIARKLLDAKSYKTER